MIKYWSLILVLALTGCNSLNPLGWLKGNSSDSVASQRPTQGGDATVKIYSDRTEVTLNQPENTEEKSQIEISGVPVVTGHDEEGNAIVEQSEILVTVGGTTPLMFDKIEGVAGGSLAANIGYVAIALGLALLIARFVPFFSVFIHTWKLGASVMGAGFGIIMVDSFLAQYGMISCFILIIIGVIYYAHRKGLVKEVPHEMKKKKAE